MTTCLATAMCCFKRHELRARLALCRAPPFAKPCRAAFCPREQEVGQADAKEAQSLDAERDAIRRS